ncbi:mitogen-activated protein kinase kinase kinase 4 isoform X2 [Chrysoperla carnea]|uniref:mitogen-activated protein kinase kinase kinase 4 isoform X2 n=1 Tax=Chrysoperla carnea TaxID=189513 RepID=UPI001D06BA18|nr:mitogen-activated protein kinase kinase kinase 4 isoform X2 [Chrysoperla carnea]
MEYILGKYWKSKTFDNLSVKSSEVGGSATSLDSFPSPLAEDTVDCFDKFGSTPPRTRISRRQRERRQKDKEHFQSERNSKRCRCPFSRRSTIDAMVANTTETLSDVESTKNSTVVENTTPKRMDKRSMKLLRDSERDFKLHMGTPSAISTRTETTAEDRANSMPAVLSPPIKIPTLIETCNRFMCLTSRPVNSRFKKKIEGLRTEYKKPEITCKVDDTEDIPEDRVEFNKKISKSVRLGCTEHKLQRQESINQNQIWQNEVQDLIWLELQAFHADRTLCEEDCYLCTERTKVGKLLESIMNYKFKRVPHNEIRLKRNSNLTTYSNDSGVGGYDSKINNMIQFNEASKQECTATTPWGCASILCTDCMINQKLALQEVEQILLKMDAATALYPSTKALAAQYPLYKSPQFTAKFKAMSIWYNLTKENRGQLFSIEDFISSLYGNGKYNWQLSGTDNESGIVNIDNGSEDSGQVSMSRSISSEKSKPCPFRNPTVVKFDLDSSSSPSDSNNSTSSAIDEDRPPISEDEDYIVNTHIYTEVIPILETGNDFIEPTKRPSPYRLFILDHLRSKGLSNVVKILEDMHKSVVKKTCISLDRPIDGTSFQDYCEKFCGSCNVKCSVDDCELRRYGFWSPETQAMNLPSYIAPFMFLTCIPIRVIFEYLKLKVEKKLVKPSPLSIGQLMRELKDGLRIFVRHRERFLYLLNQLMTKDDPNRIRYEKFINNLDTLAKSVFEIYIDYLEQCSLMYQHETFQKSFLEEEWTFVKSIYPHIPEIKPFVAMKICSIVCSMFRCIYDTISTRVEELESSIHTGISADDNSESRHCMWFFCRKLLRIINEEKERTLKALSFVKTLRKDLHGDDFLSDSSTRNGVVEALIELRSTVFGTRSMLDQLIERLEQINDIPGTYEDLDEVERSHLQSKCCNILHQAFKFGFELYLQHHADLLELRAALDNRNVLNSARKKMHNYVSTGMISFAQNWMRFVIKRCERGRGKKPRWASHGLEFLCVATDPLYTKHLTPQEFEDFKNEIENCIQYIIGTSTPSPDVTNNRSPFSKSRGVSPQPSFLNSPSMKQKLSFSKIIKDNPDKYLHANGDSSPEINSKYSPQFDKKVYLTVPSGNRHIKSLRSDRIRDSVNKLEMQLDQKLRSNDLIGQVTATHSVDRIYIKSRVVTFSWQRGTKIGQGRFGKVYTAVNNETGELLAMKEITLQPNDHKMIKRVAEEIKTFEGIKHEHLVRYFGVEIHREEMLIFMEFCDEGTLENLVAATEGGLPEPLIRQYTRQLLSAVETLHNHFVAHRDIKSANIFLTDQGNCLKLGDFGSAVKIKMHTTMPGELQGFVGTQAYMAPEVFMKTNADGHGRAADIWSVGCVVVEMSSGKRPWSQYDSNYQIMFVVGMGETPDIPDRLSDEGKEFLDNCLQHDPKNRDTATVLLQHNFVKVDMFN